MEDVGRSGQGMEAVRGTGVEGPAADLDLTDAALQADLAELRSR
ncbi:hypothetical protein AEMCBJ_31975 (plasmid) [Cupriavidus necator]